MYKRVCSLIKSIEAQLDRADVLQEIGEIDSVFEREDIEKTHPVGSTSTHQTGPGREAAQKVKAEGGSWQTVPKPPLEVRDTDNVKLPDKKGRHHSNTL